MNKFYLLVLTLSFSFYFTSAQKPVASFSSSDTVMCANDCITFTDLSTNNPTSWKWSFQGGLPSTSTAQNPFVCYLDTGSHDVTLIAINGSGSDTLMKTAFIIVKPSPPTPIINQSHDTLFCITDTEYVSYQWYSDTSLVSGATNSFYVPDTCANYNVLVKNRYGCGIAVGINILLYQPDFTCNGDTICVSPYYNLYQWSYNGTDIPGATNACIVALNPGSYSVTLTFEGSCVMIAASTCSPQGLTNFSDNNKIIVFPNPLTSSSILQLNGQVINADAIIYDMLGKEMRRSKINGNRMEIEKGSLESGVYFLTVKDNERQYIKKIVVE